MLKTFTINAWRLLAGNKLFSAINIVGLSVGLAACLLIALYVGNELSWDRHWDGAERLFRVNYVIDNNGNGDFHQEAFQPTPMLPVFQNYFSTEVEAATRVLKLNRQLQVGEFKSFEDFARVDPQFPELFQMDILAGDIAHTLEDPLRIAISADMAIRFFGSTDVLGETVSIPAGPRLIDYSVSAVYRMPDQESVMDLAAITRFDPQSLPNNMGESWILTGPMVFIKLRDAGLVDTVANQTPNFIDAHVDVRERLQYPPDQATSDRIRYVLQDIRDIHLNSEWDTFNPSGNRVAVYAFAAIAILILIIACANFVILTTARASHRAREIAMRKTVGATRGQLFRQFMGETGILTLLALGLAIALVELVLPVFNAFAGVTLAVTYTSPASIAGVLIMLILVGIAGGIYPAYLLSGFRPAKVLSSGPSGNDDKTLRLRSALVVFQFSISIALLVATAVIFAQVRYGLYRDIGFDRENLVVMDVRNHLNRAEVLKQSLLDLPQVTDASLSFGRPPQASTGWYGVAYYLPNTGRARMEIRTADIGEDFFTTYKIAMLAGRHYESGRDLPLYDDYSSETGEFLERNLVINAGAARLLGFASPEAAIGNTVYMPGVGVDPREMRFTIIGVAADTRFYSLKGETPPEFYHFAPIYTRYLTARFTGSPQTVMADIRSLWSTVIGDDALSLGLVDQYLYDELNQERLEGRVLSLLSLLAITIACLGLFGLAVFTADKRVKEIGIRKVMGASVRQIVSLLIWQFSRPVLLANLVAWPWSCWIMIDWLQGFPDRIALWLLVPFCLFAGLFALGIAWLTVAGTTLRVATTSPVHSLRYE